LTKSFSSQKVYSDKQYICFRKQKMFDFLGCGIQACNFCTHFNCVYGDGLIDAFANKITKIIRIWGKQSVKQFLKSKSTFENNIYRIVAFSQVL